MAINARLPDWIDGFQPAKGAPPRRLAGFIFWCLRGATGMLVLAALVSAMAGTLEVSTAYLMGLVVDGALADGADFLTLRWPFLLAVVGFFLVLRPLMFGLSATMQSLVVGPNVMPLVLSRLNRYTLGHSVQFFENDFAGRIAQKQLQVARAVTDVVTELINTIAFALASLVGSVLFLASIDWRVGLVLSGWVAVYLALIRWFMPRIRTRAGRRAGARAMLTGQLVDTVTNIKTVKLFAHHRHEDNAALGAMRSWRETAIGFGWLASAFRFALMLVAGLVPVLLLGGTLLLWSRGAATAGDIVATGAIAMRIAQMTGWVSFTLMTIYSHIGEIEDGMKTLTPAHGLVDSGDARRLIVRAAEIRVRHVSFAYGGEQGGVTGIDLTIAPREKLGIVGASGAGKSTLMALLLRLYDAEEGEVLIDGQDVRSVTQESLRREIGMVTQETAMFNRSARDNIRYGRPEATDQQVMDAARRAEAHDFIVTLEDHVGRRVMMPILVNTASNCRAGSGSVSPWRAPFLKTLRSSCWTRRQAPSTVRSRRRFRQPSPG